MTSNIQKSPDLVKKTLGSATLVTVWVPSYLWLFNKLCNWICDSWYYHNTKVITTTHTPIYAQGSGRLVSWNCSEAWIIHKSMRNCAVFTFLDTLVKSLDFIKLFARWGPDQRLKTRDFGSGFPAISTCNFQCMFILFLPSSVKIIKFLDGTLLWRNCAARNAYIPSKDNGELHNSLTFGNMKKGKKISNMHWEPAVTTQLLVSCMSGLSRCSSRAVRKRFHLAVP